MRPSWLGFACAAVLASVPGARGEPHWCGTRPGLERELVAQHRYRAGGFAAVAARAQADRDEDDVAVLEDRGDLVARRNPFDLAESAVRLAPNGRGGYDAAPLQQPAGPAGDALELGREPRLVELPFAFPFYGEAHSRVFVHADGNLTLGEPGASSPPGLSALLAGPPRIAPFFAGLDPARGGRVSLRLSAGAADFLWEDVPGGGQLNRNTFGVRLAADGAITFAWGRLESREAVIGVAPGGGLELVPADFSRGLPLGSTGALVERFNETEELDLVSVAQRFYATHGDAFEQLVVYTARPLNPVGGSLAFEINVRNDVTGIGLDVFDDSADWGSAGRLESVVFMDAIEPYIAVDGFEILGHEIGHRWLARLRVGASGAAGGEPLLGRSEVHWSFFLDSDASVMEGNDIEDLGDGRFVTVDLARRFSALDQYAMGLRGRQEVPRFFYVAEADDFRPNRTFKVSSAPEVGVRFTGLRRDLGIEDVVAALGERRPEAGVAPRVLHQAFVLVADAEAAGTPERVAAVARIRRRLHDWYRQATAGRGEVETRLR